MKLIEVTGKEDLAQVFVVALEDGAKIECVQSVQRPLSLGEKWVLIVSTLKGCPVGCPICDAGGRYTGKLTKEEIISQIRLMISRKFPSGDPLTRRLKIQFARMGEPAFNDAVLDVLEALPETFSGAPIQPSISTVAPVGRYDFFARLINIKDRLYGNGWFQMQFSVHTTDDGARRRLIPIKTLPLDEIAALGNRFYSPGDRKVSLNFAPAEGFPLDAEGLVRQFSPERFIVKLTPINPTVSATESKLVGIIDPGNPEACQEIVQQFTRVGFETILSIGDLEENQIGSNCGMYVGKADCGNSKVA